MAKGAAKGATLRMIPRVIALGCLLGLTLLVPCLAMADDAPATPPPDKSGFTLFNPTPDTDERSFCTDRPTKSTGTCTVDAGHFQIESDVFNATIDRSFGVDTDTYLFTNPTLKLGVTNTIDVELNMVPFEEVDVKDRRTGVRTRMEGVGDLFGRVKINLLGDDGGDVAFALEPFVKAPTASGGLGNGAVEEGLIAPIQINLPLNWSLTVDPEADLLKNALGNGRHANFSYLFSFSRSVSKTLTLSAEFWSDINLDPQGTVRQYSFDLGAAWIPQSHPNFQLDGGVNIGQNNATPGVQAYLGVSQRF
jgi:hypothetical protein